MLVLRREGPGAERRCRRIRWSVLGSAALALVHSASSPLASSASATAAESRYARTVAVVELPDVSLIAADGATVALREELAPPGPLLVQFAFTTCSTVCPVLSGTIAAVQETLPALHIVSISIDPEADTPARLREHATRFRAGPRWRMLTGTPEAVVAVQRAFDVYRGDKMRHEPVLFLRADPDATWVRLQGFPSADDLVNEVGRLVAAGDPERGRRLYRDGVAPAGRTVDGVLQGSIAVSGPVFTCASCHRRSGFGGVEGTVFVPPVTAPALFAERPLAGPWRFRELFREELEPSHWSRLRDAPWRAPYTEASLAAALRAGRDPAGRALDPLMPRYALTDPEVRDLAAYLRTLGAVAPLGVDGSTVHIATVVAGAVDPTARQAMLDVMAAFVRWRNADVGYNLRRPEALRYDDTAAGLRRWQLHVWELEGDAASWPEQLVARHRERPVFALLGGLAAGSWSPIAAFCEREEIPCVFPNTDLPADAPGEVYTVYLWPGLRAEASAVGDALRRHARSAPAMRVLQVVRDEPRGREAARALREALRDLPGVRLDERVLAAAGAPSAAEWVEWLGSRPDALVLWLASGDLEHLPAAPDPIERAYLSASLVGEERPPLPEAWREVSYLASPFAPPGDAAPHRYRARAWLRSRGVEPRREPLQLSTYFTLSLADHALMDLGRELSRDAFLEAVERETEREPNPGPYLRLTLGPGQRVAAKGCAVRRLDEAMPHR